MQRRKFITLLGGAAAGWPLAARAQQPERARRIGALSGLAANHPDTQAFKTAFLQGLQQLGWTDGRNVQIEYRWGGGNADNIRIALLADNRPIMKWQSLLTMANTLTAGGYLLPKSFYIRVVSQTWKKRYCHS